MTKCVAAWCRNSSFKGFQMNSFPQDEKRRDVWIKNINRAKWSPTKYSALCEAHFAPEMWKRKIRGQKKLKSSAIPTIFVKSKTGDESQNECNKKSYRSKETNSEQITDNNKNLYENNAIESNALKEKSIEKNISESLSDDAKTISNSMNNRYILKININKIYNTH